MSTAKIVLWICFFHLIPIYLLMFLLKQCSCVQLITTTDLLLWLDQWINICSSLFWASMALLHKLHSSENQSQPACLESVAVWLGKLALLPVTALICSSFTGQSLQVLIELNIYLGFCFFHLAQRKLELWNSLVTMEKCDRIESYSMFELKCHVNRILFQAVGGTVCPACWTTHSWNCM